MIMIFDEGMFYISYPADWVSRSLTSLGGPVGSYRVLTGHRPLGFLTGF